MAASSWDLPQAFPILAPIGTVQVIWNKTADACPQTKLNPITDQPVLCEEPDSVPIAWHNPRTNLSSLIAATDCTFAAKGIDLWNIHGTHACEEPQAYESPLQPQPWTFQNHQWLQSVRVYPNGTGFAFVHNEFHGEQPPHNDSCCSFYRELTPNQNCVLWSADLVVTHNGGQTWKLTASPAIALPRTYEKDMPLEGYGVLGQIQYHHGYYYAHVSRLYRNNTCAGPPNTIGRGTCVVRINDPYEASSLRGWNGSHWSTEFVDPYRVETQLEDLWKRTCQAILLDGTDTGGRGRGVSHLHVKKFARSWLAKQQRYDRGWPSYVMTGLTAGGQAVVYFPAWDGHDYHIDDDFDDEKLAKAPFSAWTSHDASPVDLSEWTDPCFPELTAPMMYPNLIDHDSPFGLSHDDHDDDNAETKADGLSYGLIGNSSLYLYYIVRREFIVRVPVAWFVPGQTSPRGPYPKPVTPPPLNPIDCQVISVQGGGGRGEQGGPDSVNGLYHVHGGPDKAGGRLRYRMDVDHWIYHFQKQWILGRPGTAGRHYVTAPVDVAGQGLGVPETWGGCNTVRATCIHLSASVLK